MPLPNCISVQGWFCLIKLGLSQSNLSFWSLYNQLISMPVNNKALLLTLAPHVMVHYNMVKNKSAHVMWFPFYEVVNQQFQGLTRLPSHAFAGKLTHAHCFPSPLSSTQLDSSRNLRLELEPDAQTPVPSICGWNFLYWDLMFLVCSLFFISISSSSAVLTPIACPLTHFSLFASWTCIRLDSAQQLFRAKND